MPEVAVVVGQVETPSNHSSTFWVYAFHGGNHSSSTLCKSHVNWGAYKRNTLGPSQNAGEWSLTLVKSTKGTLRRILPLPHPKENCQPLHSMGHMAHWAHHIPFLQWLGMLPWRTCLPLLNWEADKLMCGWYSKRPIEKKEKRKQKQKQEMCVQW